MIENLRKMRQIARYWSYTYKRSEETTGLLLLHYARVRDVQGYIISSFGIRQRIFEPMADFLHSWCRGALGAIISGSGKLLPFVCFWCIWKRDKYKAFEGLEHLCVLKVQGILSFGQFSR